MAQTVLITGANRGIGLGLANYFLAQGDRVLAAARNPHASRDLWELERDYGTRVKILELDVTAADQVENTAKQLAAEPIDLLIHNAGILPANQHCTKTPIRDFEQAMAVNCFGVIRLTQCLLSSLLQSPRPVICALSSVLGSINENKSGGYGAYRVSKAALNMFMHNLAVENPKLVAFTVHPGWVKTDMGGPNATTSVDESVQGIGQLISQAQPEMSGKFYDFHGKSLPW